MKRRKKKNRKPKNPSLAPTAVEMDKAQIVLYVIVWVVLASILWLGEPEPPKTSK